MVVRRICLYTAAALTAVILMTFLFLGPILNSPFVKPWIVNYIENQVNTEIDPDQVTFLLTPQLRIQVDTVTLPLTREIELSVEAVRLDLDLNALLKRKIEISGIFLKNLGIQTLPGENKTGLTFHAPLIFNFPHSRSNRYSPCFRTVKTSYRSIWKIQEPSSFQRSMAVCGFPKPMRQCSLTHRLQTFM